MDILDLLRLLDFRFNHTWWMGYIKFICRDGIDVVGKLSCDVCWWVFGCDRYHW